MLMQCSTMMVYNTIPITLYLLQIYMSCFETNSDVNKVCFIIVALCFQLTQDMICIILLEKRGAGVRRGGDDQGMAQTGREQRFHSALRLLY